MNFSMLHPADQIVMIMNRLYSYQMTTTSGGNLSIMDDEGVMWISPSGVDKGNLTTADMVRSADSCGVYTGRKVEKFTRFHLTKEESSFLSCPLIGESPLSLACRVTDVLPLGSHDMFLADIVGIEVDPALIDRDGRLHLEWAHLAAFAHGQYYELGRQIGAFGFSVKKDKKPHPKKKPPAKKHEK